MALTSGTVKYGRTVNGGDYNSKRADVELTFTFAEGGDDEAEIQRVSELAVFKTHQILQGISVGAATRAGASVPDTTEAAPAESQVKPVRRGRPPKSEGPQLDPTDPSAPKETVPDPAPVEEVVENPTTAPTAGVATDPTEVLDDWETPAEVTDVDLTAAISKHNGVVKNGPAIRELVAKYVGKSPSQAREIEQGKRAAFLADLVKIGPLGA